MSGLDDFTGRSIIEDVRDEMGGEQVVFGFDGYIDRVREIVDERQDQVTYRRVQQLDDLGEQISAAAEEERSILMEWVRPDMRTGGHVCHISRALGRLDYEPTMIGMFGEPPKNPFVDEFEDYRMESLGEPAYTDAIEFDDGKFMLTESGGMRSLDWERICAAVGVDQLAEYLDGAAVFGMGYWAEIADMISIFEGLAEEVVPSLSSPPEHVLIDPADVGKRPTGEIKRGGDALARLDAMIPVTVSANRYETTAIADSLVPTDDQRSQMDAASVAREQLGISRFVSHGANKSALASASDLVAVDVPRTDDPVVTTGAGDHFNAGVILGLIHGLEPHETVALGNTLAGCFVRQGNSPSYQTIETFLNSYTLQNWQSTN